MSFDQMISKTKSVERPVWEMFQTSGWMFEQIEATFIQIEL